MSKRKKKKNYKRNIISIILILLSFLYGTYFQEINTTFRLIYEDAVWNNNSNTNTIKVDKKINNDLTVYFIDVGQADAILINSNNEYMMIDGGNSNDGALLVKYLQSLNITELKYVVATHPHEDHIGGLDDIINSFKIDNIYMPDAITTTKTFEDLLNAIDNKNMQYTTPKINSSFNLGNSTIKVIYTGTDTTDLNNTSIVLKLTYKDISFLFTGDATDKTEEKILNKDIESTILKVGHHGSRYSSTDDFIKKVNPKYAIISVGANNKYGHPANETLTKLNKLNIETHRTDKEGTIKITTDGKNINISTEKTNTNGG